MEDTECFFPTVQVTKTGRYVLDSDIMLLHFRNAVGSGTEIRAGQSKLPKLNRWSLVRSGMELPLKHVIVMFRGSQVMVYENTLL